MQNIKSNCWIIFLKPFPVIYFWWAFYSNPVIFLYKWFKFQTNCGFHLLWNLPNSPNKFDTNSVHQYYKNIELKDNFNLNLTTEKKVLEVLQFIDISKAAGIDKISGRFLKDGANILAKPITKICNIFISLGVFPRTAKLLNWNYYTKKDPKPILKILDSFLSYHWYQRLLKE